jgi:hypothetical protein
VRPAVATVVLGAALAVGTPTVWELTQPPATAGAPVEQALATAPAPSSPTIARSGLPQPTVRDATPAVEAAAAPRRLAAPRLGVDAPVDPVGVRADGQMALPEDVERVGWYRFGPAPGAAGSAVIAGHVDDREQGLGALAPLREAVVGDELLVTDDAGTTTRWRLVSREVISKQALPLERLFRRDGPARLTLITCGGPFLPEYGSYRDNVVVVAEPGESAPR